MLKKFDDELKYDFLSIQAEQAAEDYDIKRQLREELEWADSMNPGYAERCADADAISYGARS